MTSATDGESPTDGESSTDSDSSTVDTEGASESVVERLADELEAGTVPGEDVARLRAALFDDESGSLAARVEKLQQDVDEVLAYANALEAFLDENGTGEQLITDTRDEVDEIRSQVGAVRDEVGDLRTELDRTRQTVDRTAAGVGDVESAVADLEAELGRVDAEIESLQEWRTELVSVMSGAGVADDEGDREAQ